MKSRPLRTILLKKPDLILACFTVLTSLALSLCFIPVLQAGPQTSTSKSRPTASKPVKKSGVKSSNKTSGRKRTASRSRKPQRKVIRGQRTIESARVIEIQHALAAAGYYKQEPNGQWDDSTSKAMSAYQQDNGFRTTGKPDALSLKKLGL